MADFYPWTDEQSDPFARQACTGDGMTNGSDFAAQLQRYYGQSFGIGGQAQAGQRFEQAYGGAVGRALPAGEIPKVPFSPTSWALTGSDGETLVEVNLKNGETTFGPNYTPDKAARAFWDAVVGMAPGRTK